MNYKIYLIYKSSSCKFKSTSGLTEAINEINGFSFSSRFEKTSLSKSSSKRASKAIGSKPKPSTLFNLLFYRC